MSRHVHGPEFDSVDGRPAAMRCRWCGMILPDRRRKNHDRRDQASPNAPPDGTLNTASASVVCGKCPKVLKEGDPLVWMGEDGWICRHCASTSDLGGTLESQESLAANFSDE